MNKGVHCRPVNKNTSSYLDEILALTNFDDIISNVNINETMQLLFDRINNDFKLRCPIQTKTISPKNTTKPSLKKLTAYYFKERVHFTEICA